MTSSNAEIWDEQALDEKTDMIGGNINDIMNDDLMMATLDVVDDEFNALLDNDDEPLNAFDGMHFEASSTSSSSCKRTEHDRSLSPPPKRRQTIPDAFEAHPPSPTSVIPMPARSNSMPSIPITKTQNIEDLEDQYQDSLRKLAISMQRSEMTRQEIIRFRREAETRAKIQRAQSQSYRNADNFLNGSTSTLTTGLAHSRYMLKSYMSSMKSGLF